MINKAGSPDAGSLCSKYVINVVTGQTPFELKALNISGFCLWLGRECLRTSSKVKVTSVSVMYMFVTFR